MRKSSTFLLLSFFYLNSFSQHVSTLRIDPENARGGTVSQLFDSIQFIPLETTKESLFGSIDQLEVSDSLYFILDARSRSLLLFNKNGSLMSRIESGGIDKYFTYFTIDRIKKTILIGNNYAKGLLIYDFKGTYLETVSCPEHIQSLYCFGSSKMLYNLNRFGNSGEKSRRFYDLAYATQYNSDLKYLNPFNPQFQDGEYNILTSPINFSGQQGSCMFSLPFDYNVYQLNDTGVINTYQFIFPLQYSLPQNFARDSAFKGKRAKYVYLDHDNYKKIQGLTSVFRIEDYLVFSAPTGQMTFGADWNYLYNLKNGNLFSFSKVTADSTSLYFPLMSSIMEKADAVYKNVIYTSLPSFRIFAIKNNLDKKIAYPESMQKFLTTGSKTNNPVLVLFRIKPNL